MPINLDRSNPMIAKRIIKKGGLNENKGSDASCYGEIEILVMTVDERDSNRNRTRGQPACRLVIASQIEAWDIPDD